MVELDGRTGEGGGQLVRIAIGLSALTGTPVHIHHVRGNRPGGKHGGGGGETAIFNVNMSCPFKLTTFRLESPACFLRSMAG